MAIMRDPVYRVNPQWHSNPGRMRVICPGAGAAGILVAYKMKKMVSNYELVCYEKNREIGGTWYENKYPGAACDIPSHMYSFTFEPNPNWSTFYSFASEIKQYLEDFVDRYQLREYIQLNSKVVSAVWSEDQGIYNVEVERDGNRFQDWCHVFIDGSGFLNDWKWPTIPGLHDFKGPVVHTADWDPTIDWRGKTIAIIGMGSSAVQILPHLQKGAKRLVSFMRSKTWISAPVQGALLEKTKKASADVRQRDSTNKQYWFTEEEKRRFHEDPAYFLQYRRNLEANSNATFDVFIAGTNAAKLTKEAMREEMHRRIGPGHEELKANLIPSFSVGCRRITPGDGYLEALTQSNVTNIHKEIVEVVSDGLIDEAGTHHQADMIVCATGFKISFAPPFVMKGVGGVSMADEFDPFPHIYLGVSVPKFPNYFVVNGARGNWASGVTLPTHEVQIEYILQCVRRMQEEKIHALEVKLEPIEQLYEHIDEWMKGSVWNEDCRSWYKNGIVGGKVWTWGGSSLHYMKTMKYVRWEHYTLRYKDDRNMWSFLGNGRIEAEVRGDLSKMAPYVRDKDEAWEV